MHIHTQLYFLLLGGLGSLLYKVTGKAMGPYEVKAGENKKIVHRARLVRIGKNK